MSAEAAELSREDKFFGVTTPLQIPEKEAPEAKATEQLELEIVDDLPKQPVKQAEKEENDEELSDYSDKVRKRINKLKYEQHEAQRQREAAERMREEAIKFAQQVVAKNQQYESLIQRGEGALVAQIKARASLSLDQAKSLYKEAYEAGDAQKIIEAQEKLLNAQTEFREAEKHERVLQNRPRQQAPQVQYTPQNYVPPQPQVPQPSSKALEWTKRNPWFGPQGNRSMTALAYGIHETLIREEGVQADTDEYYQKIDAAMRQRFPDYFEKDEEVQVTSAPTQRTPSTVVAPSNRNNGARPRKIQLTASQVSLAKRLGISPEQYAKQLIKESSNG
jgi:hypothetical protein